MADEIIRVDTSAAVRAIKEYVEALKLLENTDEGVIRSLESLANRFSRPTQSALAFNRALQDLNKLDLNHLAQGMERVENASGKTVEKFRVSLQNTARDAKQAEEALKRLEEQQLRLERVNNSSYARAARQSTALPAPGAGQSVLGGGTPLLGSQSIIGEKRARTSLVTGTEEIARSARERAKAEKEIEALAREEAALKKRSLEQERARQQQGGLLPGLSQAGTPRTGGPYTNQALPGRIVQYDPSSPTTVRQLLGSIQRVVGSSEALAAAANARLNLTGSVVPSAYNTSPALLAAQGARTTQAAQAASVLREQALNRSLVGQYSLSAEQRMAATRENLRRSMEELTNKYREAARLQEIIKGRITSGKPPIYPPGRGGGAGDGFFGGGGPRAGGFGANFTQGFIGTHGSGAGAFGFSIGQAARFGIVYGTMYRLLTGITNVFKDALQTGIAFQRRLTELSIATGESRDQVKGLANSLARTATEQGFAPDVGVRAGIKSAGVFQALDRDSAYRGAVARSGAEATTKFAFITGRQADQIQEEVGAIVQAFSLGADQINRVFDADLFFSKRLGVDSGNTIQAIAPVAALGQKAGFSVEQLAAAAAAIQSRMATTGSATAGFLSQILSREGEGAITEAFNKLGIKPGGSYAQRLTETQNLYTAGQLSPGQLQTLAAAGGRGRSQSAFLAFLQSGAKNEQALAEFRQKGAGTTEKTFEELSQDLGGKLRKLGGSFQNLEKQLSEGGLIEAFTQFTSVIKVGVDAGAGFLQLKNTLPDLVKEVLLAYFAFRLLNRFGVVSAVGNRILARSALPTGALLRREAGPLLEGQTRLAGGAAVRAAGVGGLGRGAIAALGLNPVTASLLGIAVVAGGLYNSYNKHKEALQKATDALLLSGTANLEDADALRASADALRKAADDVERDGIFGPNNGIKILGKTIIPALPSPDATEAAGRNRVQATALEGLAKIKENQIKNQTNAYFGDFSEDTVKEALDQLSVSGRNAVQVLEEYNSAIDENGRVSAKALRNQFDPNVKALESGTALAGQLPSLLENLTFPKKINTLFDSKTIDAPLKALFGDLSSSFDAPGLTENIRGAFKKNGIDGASTREAVVKALVEAIVTNIDTNQELSASEKAAIKGSGFVAKAANLIYTQQYNQTPEDLTVVKTSRDAIGQLDASQGAYDKALQASGPAFMRPIIEGRIKLIRQFIANVRKNDSKGNTSELIDRLQDEEARLAQLELDGLKGRTRGLLAQGKISGSQVLKSAQATLRQAVTKAAQIGVASGDFSQLKDLLVNADKATVDIARKAVKRFLEAQLADDLARAESGREIDAIKGAFEANVKKTLEDFDTQAVLGAASESDTKAQVAAAAQAARAAGTRSKVDDAVAELSQAQADADALAADGKTNSVAYQNALGRINSAELALADAKRDEVAGIKSILGAQVGGQLAQAISAVEDANRAMAEAVTDAEKNAAQIQQLVANHQLQEAQSAYRHNARLLRLDRTNPAQVAAEAARQARDDLRRKEAEFRGAGSAGGSRITKPEQDVLNDLRLKAEDAQQDARSTKLRQSISAAQTAYNLGRLSHTAYMKFIDDQINILEAQIKGMKKTTNGYKDATDTLNDLYGIAKEAADSLNAQFNLGDITLPTPYQVRSYIKATTTPGGQGAGSNTNVNSNNTITVSGLTTEQVQAFFEKFFGNGNTNTGGGY